MIALWLLAGILAKQAEDEQPQFVFGGSRRGKPKTEPANVEAVTLMQRNNEALALLLT